MIANAEPPYVYQAVIGGTTGSSTFPTTPNAYSRTFHPKIKGVTYSECFVTRLNEWGTAQVYSTYLGGNTDDAVTALAVVPGLNGGRVIAAGNPSPTGWPLVPPSETSGSTFLAELDTNLFGTPSLVYSSYLGSPSGDSIQGAAVAPAGARPEEWFLGGWTTSALYPATNGSHLNGTAKDATIMRLTP